MFQVFDELIAPLFVHEQIHFPLSGAQGYFHIVAPSYDLIALWIILACGLNTDWNSMAFDMYAGDLRLSINHSEEHILLAASQAPESYPELTKVWEEFYDPAFPK